MAHQPAPHGTPLPPQWSPDFVPEEFLDEYDYWCVSACLDDENVLAAKFAYSFMDDATLRKAVQGIYRSTQTWAQMRAQCLQLLRECSNNSDGDYESALVSFEGPDNYQKYGEKITMFARRWAQAYDLFAKARATHGLAAWNTAEQLLEFKKRLVAEMHNLVLKKKHQIPEPFREGRPRILTQSAGAFPRGEPHTPTQTPHPITGAFPRGGPHTPTQTPHPITGALPRGEPHTPTQTRYPDAQRRAWDPDAQGRALDPDAQ